VRTNANNFRCRLTRLTAAGVVGAAMLLAGCNAAEGPQKKPLLPFSKNARDESIRQQAQSDSFPTARQAGLKAAAKE
jgi:hypothetical protein